MTMFLSCGLRYRRLTFFMIAFLSIIKRYACLVEKDVSKHALQPFLLSEVESRTQIRILADEGDGKEGPPKETDASEENNNGESVDEAPVPLPVPVDQANNAPVNTPTVTTDTKKKNMTKKTPVEPEPETINSVQCSDEISCLSCKKLSLQKSSEKNSNETCTWKDNVCSTIELNVDADQAIVCDSKPETGNDVESEPTPELDSAATAHSDEEINNKDGMANASASDNPTSTPSLNPTKKPTAAPIATTSKTTDEPTTTPTSAPTGTPTKLPITAPVTNDGTEPSNENENQIPTMDNEDLLACSPAKSCTECKDLAKALSEEQDSTKTCSWDDNKCHITDITASNGSIECATEKVPNNSEFDNNEDLFANIPGHAIFGVLFLVVCFGIMIRRIRKSNIFARNSLYVQKNNTSNYGKYEGVNTKSDDDDDGWGWDEETPKQRGSVEMSNVGGTKNRLMGGSNARQRSTSTSPQFGGFTADPMPPPIENHASSKTEKKGLSVKKTGMNNPLHLSQSHAAQTTAPSSTMSNRNTTTTSTTVAPIRKIVPPSNDDFFAEMGIAPKPKFGSASPSTTKVSQIKRLGATTLPLDDDDDDNDLLTGNGTKSNTKGTWDDDDLDDLLDS